MSNYNCSHNLKSTRSNPQLGKRNARASESAASASAAAASGAKHCEDGADLFEVVGEEQLALHERPKLLQRHAAGAVGADGVKETLVASLLLEAQGTPAAKRPCAQ